MFTPRAQDQLVRLALRPGAVWVSDYYPVESIERTPDGGAIIDLRTADTAWLRRLMWQLGPQAIVMEPTGLADEVGRGARAALQGYAGSASCASSTSPSG